jgi:hypothetical protein
MTTSSTDARKYIDYNEYSNDSTMPRIEAGIHENVYLMPISTGKTNAGKAIVEFGLTFPSGRVILLSEYEPTRFPEDSDMKYERNQRKALARLISISDVYEELQAEEMWDADATQSEKMEQYATKLIAFEGRKSIPLRIKLVYNKDGYLRFPNGINRKGENQAQSNVFMELMSAKPSQIVIKDTDNLTKPEYGSDASNKSEKVSTNIDDLPF